MGIGPYRWSELSRGAGLWRRIGELANGMLGRPGGRRLMNGSGGRRDSKDDFLVPPSPLAERDSGVAASTAGAGPGHWAVGLCIGIMRCSREQRRRNCSHGG